MTPDRQVLIFSTIADVATDYVVHGLARRGVAHHRINTEDLPFSRTLTLSLGGRGASSLAFDDHEIAQPSAVWYRRVRSPSRPCEMQEGGYQFCLQANSAANHPAMLTFWRATRVRILKTRHYLKETRRNGGFDFNMNSQLQMDSQIGEKLKLPINYNTLANFNFENQLKLDFRGKDDDIVKMFQAGNTNFASKGTLIPGAQSLFGVKTQLQFGKLFITTVLANQQSQRQTMGLQGGTSAQRISLKADEYDENRHFLMSQYLRSNYNTAMKNCRSSIQKCRY